MISKSFLHFALMITAFSSFSQNPELALLKIKKEQINNTIKLLTDSLGKVEGEISKIEAMEIQETMAKTKAVVNKKLQHIDVQMRLLKSVILTRVIVFC